MIRTRWSLLFALLALSAAFSWFVEAVVLRLNESLLPLGWGSAFGVGSAAALLAMWGWHARERLPKLGKDDEGKPMALRSSNPLPPIIAARTVAIAMAASRSGSMLAGFYVGCGLTALAHWRLEISQLHLLVAAVTFLLSLVLTGVGLWVEKMCTLPPPPSAEASPA